ncbi:hypothetical protein TNCV_1800921 [Trichonephila clavipes]|nr:hypothetical protein TNCV_1800921 [Trichonephila clavipes]
MRQYPKQRRKVKQCISILNKDGVCRQVNGAAGPTELLRVGGRRMVRCSGEMGRRAVPFPTLPGVSGRRDGLS